MSERARQQEVNFLMWDLVTVLLAILLLGLFCGGEELLIYANLSELQSVAPGLPCRRLGTLLSALSTTRKACDPQDMWP